MNKSPLISIITVVFNGDQYLQQTIDSVKDQTYKNIEYIIVDGGSTDGTLDIINKNQDVISKWISEPDNGLYDAMNKGVKMASGELIGTINSDDWYQTNAIQIVVNEYIKNLQKKIFHGDINCINDNRESHVKKAKNSSFLIKYHGMVLNHPTMFIHKDVYIKHNYNVELSALADYQFVLENYLRNKEDFYYIPQIISNFRLGGISGMLSDKKSLNENFIARRNAGMSFGQIYFAYLFRLLFLAYKRIR